MKKEEIIALSESELTNHLNNELLPRFWLDRMKDNINGGFITHFDEQGNDTGEDEKSLIAQTRCIRTLYRPPCRVWRWQMCRIRAPWG
ncbi:hypothetical protein MASR1M31_02410 [Porphyromonadaceae bacterium]